MPIGSNDPINDDIINLGKIKNTGIFFEQNSSEILRKIRKQLIFGEDLI